MAWIIKRSFAFNLYLGEDNKTVNSISEAKIYKTKKAALEATKDIKDSIEILKKL